MVRTQGVLSSYSRDEVVGANLWPLNAKLRNLDFAMKALHIS